MNSNGVVVIDGGKTTTIPLSELRSESQTVVDATATLREGQTTVMDEEYDVRPAAERLQWG